ncbi:MAG: hypothetical protein D6715_07710 [Calditrichaeota bacterium]|nr:MAG: hypothetical protein D6715_07710 [Calditrichota bacterium]
MQFLPILSAAGSGRFLCTLALTGIFTLSSAQTLHLAYTANINGTLTDCGCGEEPVGGIDRLATLIDSLRRAHPDLILLDGGDLLRSYSLPRLNAFVLQWAARMGYDALNVGDQELVEGMAFLAAQAHPLPWVSLNLQFPALAAQTGSFRPRGELTITRDSAQVMVTGLTSPQAFSFITPPPDLRMEPPQRALLQLQAMPSGPRVLTVVLFHGDWPEAEALASQLPEGSLLLVAHSQQLRVKRLARCTLLEPGPDAQYLTSIEARFRKKGWEIHTRFLPVSRAIRPQKAIFEEAQRLLKQLKQGP